MRSVVQVHLGPPERLYFQVADHAGCDQRHDRNHGCQPPYRAESTRLAFDQIWRHHTLLNKVAGPPAPRAEQQKRRAGQGQVGPMCHPKWLVGPTTDHRPPSTGRTPARRSQVHISWSHERWPQPLYVIPIQGYVVLTTSEVALAGLAPEVLSQLYAVLDEARGLLPPPPADATGQAGRGGALRAAVPVFDAQASSLRRPLPTSARCRHGTCHT